MQFLELVGKYVCGRRVVFPHELHLKLEGVLLREGSFLFLLCKMLKGKIEEQLKR